MLWLVNKWILFVEFLKTFKSGRILGVFLVLILGALKATIDAYPDKDLLINIYSVFSLFTLNADAGDLEHHPWLEFFAFINPAFAGFAVVVAFAESIARKALGLVLPKGDHVIVLGAGEWGLRYARSLAESNQNVVVIDANPSDQAYEEVISRRLDGKSTGKGNLFLVKAYFDEHSHDKLLEKVNASKAKKIITMFDGDEANVDAAYALKSSDKVKGESNPPTIMLPVDNIRLSASLAVYNRFSEFEGKVEIRSFNIMQQAAVRHFQEHPPELYADIFGQKDIHFAVYGLGDVAINLIYVIGQLCHYRTWELDCKEPRKEVKKVRVTVLDQDVEKAKKELDFLFPNLRQVLDVDILPCASTNGISSHDYFLPQGEKDSENIPPITQHFLCFKDEMLSIRCAIKLRKQQMKFKGLNTPIFVRSQNGQGLTRLIESSCNKSEWPDNVFPYVILSNKLDDDIYFSDEVEKIAKAFNNWEVVEKPFYRYEKNKTPFWKKLCFLEDKYCSITCKKVDLKKKEKNQQWESLSSAFKHSSFFQAAYLRIRLRSLGYDWVNISDETKDEVVDKALIQHLALLEHQRYKGERWMMGWDKGSRTLGDIAKLHPELEELSSNEQWGDKYDIKQATMLHKYLEEAECILVKRPVVSQDKDLSQNHVFMFNMLNPDSRKSAEEIVKSKKCGEVIGLLPLPFEVIKALLPLVWDANELSKCVDRENERLDYLLKCFGLNETTKDEKGDWIENTLQSIAKLSGKIDLYIEMPVQHSFDKWLKDEKDKPSKIESNLCWLEEACKQTDDYIDCRTGKSGKRKSSFLPKPSIKAIQ